jgi:uncharacterized protein
LIIQVTFKKTKLYNEDKMTEKVEKIMYIATCGGDNPEKACLPFVLATAAIAMDIEATIVLQSNGAYLLKESYRKNMLPGGGFPDIDKLFKDFLDYGGKLFVCGPCIKERKMDPSELPEAAEIGAAAQVNIMAIKADAVLVF